MGRHLIGYEVQMVLAGVDYFSALPQESEQPIGVAGYGEGALIAFYAAAVDDRIDSALVSGYFQPREQLHREPVYRNVYGLLREFGDADIASLVAPRSLVIEACRAPRAPDPPPLINGRNYAAYGKLWTPKLEEVRREFTLAKTHFQRLDIEDRIALVASDGGQGPPGTQAALVVFLESLGIDKESHDDRVAFRDRRARFDPTGRMKRQFDQWTSHTQRLVRQSRFRRVEFWKDADSLSTEKWSETTVRFRELLWDEIIGRLPQASLPPNPRTQLVYDTPQWKGYEVMLDVYPGVFQYGMLLVPKDLQPDERRPVVVAQHGRNATPRHVCTPDEDTYAYHSFGAQLADRGFVVYAPQNLYIYEEHSRAIQRKAFALGMTFFAAMVRQHEQALTWLGSLPFVDSARIGFYGLSYGGKSSLLIPAVLEGYCLSICSADFNEEVWKHTSIEDRCSFMFTLEHEHTEFDFGERFNYAEIAGLIAPRPFMVERGHHDDVAPDEWVAYEYAKVRRLYLALGIRDRTEIEFFDGEHEINSQETSNFYTSISPGHGDNHQPAHNPTQLLQRVERMRRNQQVTCIVFIVMGLTPALYVQAKEPTVTLGWSQETQCYEFDTGTLFGCIDPHTWYHGVVGLVHRQHPLDVVRPRKALLNAEYYMRTATRGKMFPRQLSVGKQTRHELRQGRVLVHFPPEPAYQFGMELEYEPHGDRVDMRMTISPTRDVPGFEIFFASYVAKQLGETWVPLAVENGSQHWKKLDNRRKLNDVYQVVRDDAERERLTDGRWGTGSTIVTRIESEPFSKPILVARDAATGLALVFLCDPQVTTLLAGQYHGWDTAHDWCFGKDLVAGQSMRAEVRMIYRRFDDLPSMFAVIEREWTAFAVATETE